MWLDLPVRWTWHSVPKYLHLSIGPRTIQKLRIRILPFVFLLYVIAYLDRINIGFAALTMNKELGITSQQFGLVAGIFFFFGYFIFEVPSNLLLYKIGARTWIARILISWGTVAVLTGFVQTVHQLYLARFLLELAEAGYFPGIVLYLTYWFRQRTLSIALFMTAVPVANIVGAPPFMPNRPGQAKFLNEEEKEWISSELLEEGRQKLARHR